MAIQTAFSEKKILTEILLLYKEKPCLWNPNHEQYNNKIAREQALSGLLEKYQIICEDATTETVKKKIDHMRCAYRRERRKVLNAREIGEVHRPVLWYFDLLTFLHDDDVRRDLTTYLQETEDGSYEFEEVPNKRSKSYDFEDLPKKRTKLEEILLADPASPPRTYEDTNDPMKEESEESVVELESEAFGKTIGLQLRDLESTQRYIAEKLMSDVIFFARLNQLKPSSSIITRIEH